MRPMPETGKAPTALLAAIERLPSLSQSLCTTGFRPRKALGQHFLLDLNLTRAAVPKATVTMTNV